MFSTYQFLNRAIESQIEQNQTDALRAIGHFDPKSYKNSEDYDTIRRKVLDERDRRDTEMRDYAATLREAFQSLARVKYKGHSEMLKFWNVHE